MALHRAVEWLLVVPMALHRAVEWLLVVPIALHRAVELLFGGHRWMPTRRAKH
jgi:hypothetical protein